LVFVASKEIDIIALFLIVTALVLEALVLCLDDGVCASGSEDESENCGVHFSKFNYIYQSPNYSFTIINNS